MTRLSVPESESPEASDRNIAPAASSGARPDDPEGAKRPYRTFRD